MRRVGGFKSVADLETFSQELKHEGFDVDVKPFGIQKYLEVSSENLEAKIYLREAHLPDGHDELTAQDEKLLKLIEAVYPYEGMSKFLPACGS